MRWVSAQIDEEGGVRVPDNWLLLHYYEALGVLFRIENALRLMVYVVLKDRFGEKWRTLNITSDDNNSTSLEALTRRRSEQDDAFGYLGVPTASPLMYLTSGELVRLITHDSYWNDFSPYFRAAKNVVVLKLQEIGNIRNALAHFRPLRPDDVEVLKQNANQVFSDVERTLEAVLRCEQGVPSNTRDPWFTALRSLNADQSPMTFSQSDDRRWILVTLTFFSTVLSTTKHERPTEERTVYRLTTLRTSDVLRQFEEIRRTCLFVTEHIPPLGIPKKDVPPRFQKRLRFRFSRRVLEENVDSIKTAFEALLAQIIDESKLLADDQLARGALLHAVSREIRFKIDGERRSYTVSTADLDDPLVCPVTRESPIEYWGRFSATTDLLTDASRYPWMPAEVSAESFPF